MNNRQETQQPQERTMSRRGFLRGAGLKTAEVAAAVAGVAVATQAFGPEGAKFAQMAEAAGVPWNNGMYETFQRVEGGRYKTVDVGSLGPDVDQIIALDFEGDIPTGAHAVYAPEDPGDIRETRVVLLRRADINAIQFDTPLGGDKFDVFRVSEFGGDETLQAMGLAHAENTARTHQKVVYLGDFGLWQQQWGEGERPLLDRIVATQMPGNADLGIKEPNFVVKPRA